MKTKTVRQELLYSHNKDLNKRRKVLALAAFGVADYSFIALYQAGVIKKLPDLPFKAFDSNKVNAAPDAYMLGAPDGAVSALIYAATMVLATWKGTKKSGRKPIHDVALGAAIAGNAAGAIYYMNNMLFKQKKLCIHCLVGALNNFAEAIIIAPTVIKSIKKLFK